MITTRGALLCFLTAGGLTAAPVDFVHDVVPILRQLMVMNTKTFLSC